MATKTETTVQAQKREAADKNAARRLRTTGRIPAVLYGAKKDPVTISVDPKSISKILTSEAGHNTIFDLAIDGTEQTKAMIVDWQYEPLKGSLLHVDVKRIAMDKKLRLSVPVILKGEAAGVKTQGGILEHVLREVDIECLPADIPSHIDVDVSELVFGQVLRVSDLPHSDKVKFLTDEGQTVAHVVSVKEVVTPTAEAAAAETAPVEPEVIKKGKQETEEGAAEEKAEKKK
jgi:large subunit ribosomal protein L25